MVALGRFDKLLEGDYIETDEGLLFAVKGLFLPKGFVIAYLRYIPNPEGDRERDGHQYRRVYDLEETDEILRRRYPQYLNYFEAKGLTLQSVPLDRVSRVYSPREHLKTLVKKPESGLEKTVARFVYALSCESGVPLDRLGVSGSILIGLAKPTSDIDIIVYGMDEGHRVYDALHKLRKTRKWIKSYNLHTVKEVVRSRWDDTGLNIERLSVIEVKKILHGLVEERDYFVRLVRVPAEFKREVASTPLRKVTLRAKIVSAGDSIYTPCTYQVEDYSYSSIQSNHEVSELISYRGKFTEQVCDGDVVEVRGTIEKVVYSDQTIHRVMLGGRGDYLIPVHILDR